MIPVPIIEYIEMWPEWVDVTVRAPADTNGLSVWTDQVVEYRMVDNDPTRLETTE